AMEVEEEVEAETAEEAAPVARQVVEAEPVVEAMEAEEEVEAETAEEAAPVAQQVVEAESVVEAMEAEEEVEAETAEEAAPVAQQVVEAEPVMEAMPSMPPMAKDAKIPPECTATPTVSTRKKVPTNWAKRFSSKWSSSSSSAPSCTSLALVARAMRRFVGSSSDASAEDLAKARCLVEAETAEEAAPVAQQVVEAEPVEATEAAEDVKAETAEEAVPVAQQVVEAEPMEAMEVDKAEHVEVELPAAPAEQVEEASFRTAAQDAASSTQIFTPRCASPEAASSFLKHNYASLLAEKEADHRGDAPPSTPRWETRQRTRKPRHDIEQGGAPMSLRRGATHPRRSAILSVVVAAAAAAFAAHAAAGPVQGLPRMARSAIQRIAQKGFPFWKGLPSITYDATNKGSQLQRPEFLQYAAQPHLDVPSGAYAVGGPLNPDGLVVEA
ncbi:unnamed protein product, partial [Polarella glacialis]